MAEGDSFVVGVLNADDEVRVYWTRDIEKSLKNYRQQSKLVVPLFAVDTADGPLFCRVVGLEELPARLPIAEAAVRFGKARLAVGAQPAVFDHLGKVPLESATRLLQRWARAACEAA